jgi:hypothetical protein
MDSSRTPEPVWRVGWPRSGPGFELVFVDGEARELWAGVRGALHTVRVEVACEVDAAEMLPWELLRDPRTDRPVALEAAEYVRVNSQARQAGAAAGGGRRGAAARVAGDLPAGWGR